MKAREFPTTRVPSIFSRAHGQKTEIPLSIFSREDYRWHRAARNSFWKLIAFPWAKTSNFNDNELEGSMVQRVILELPFVSPSATGRLNVPKIRFVVALYFPMPGDYKNDYPYRCSKNVIRAIKAMGESTDGENINNLFYAYPCRGLGLKKLCHKKANSLFQNRNWLYLVLNL